MKRKVDDWLARSKRLEPKDKLKERIMIGLSHTKEIDQWLPSRRSLGLMTDTDSGPIRIGGITITKF